MLLTRSLSCIMTFLLFLSLLVLGGKMQSAQSQPVTIYVPYDYPTMQEAINNAYDGDTIYVFSGIYYENVVMNRSLAITGENETTTIIDGNNTGDVTRITANYVNVSGFTIQNSRVANAGVHLNNVSGCNIQNNIITNNTYGVSLDSSSHNSICMNNVTANGNEGIRLYSSLDNSIIKNAIVANNGCGICINLSSSTIIDENTITENSGPAGVSLEHSPNITLSINEIKGNGAYGILLSESPNSYVSENNITDHSDCAISVAYSDNATILGNNVFSNGVCGISLSACGNHILSANNITGYNHYGISAQAADNNLIAGNDIALNEYGVFVNQSSRDVLYHNNFFSNINQTKLENASSMTWDNGYPSGGNYWNDYDEIDSFGGPYQNTTGSDGIGDVPRIITENNTDSYPFMKPWTPFENQTIYIRNDGSIDPTGAPMLRSGDFYALISDASCSADGIIIEKSNVVLDGTLHTLRGKGNGTGLSILGNATQNMQNVTILNLSIRDFDLGICLEFAHETTISDNNVTCRSEFRSSYNDSMIGNNLNGISFYYSNSNNMSGNNLDGMGFTNSNYNIINGSSMSSMSFWNSRSNVICDSMVSGSVQLDGSVGASITMIGSIVVADGTAINVGGYSSADLFGNNITANGGDGISFTNIGHPGSGTVFGNNITASGGNGISGVGSHNISRNRIIAGGNGISLGIASYSNDIFENDITAESNGVLLQYSDSNNVSRNYIAHSVAGILLKGTENSVIYENSIIDCVNGIDFPSAMPGSEHNIVSGNSIVGCTDGISFGWGTKYNIVAENNISVCSQHGMLVSSEESQNNTFYHNNLADNTQHVSVSAWSNNTWNDGYPSGGNYWGSFSCVDSYRGPHQNETNSDGIGDTPYVIDENNADNYPLTKPYAGSNDIGILGSVSKTVIARGYNITLAVNLKIINYGMQTERFNFTLEITTPLYEETLRLASRNSTDFVFEWNTSGLSIGNYTLMAYVTPVWNETYLLDNNFTTVIRISIPGDVNGDFMVKPYDLALLIASYGSDPYPPNPRPWNPNCDINGDNKVGPYDLALLIAHYGQHYP